MFLVRDVRARVLVVPQHARRHAQRNRGRARAGLDDGLGRRAGFVTEHVERCSERLSEGVWGWVGGVAIFASGVEVRAAATTWEDLHVLSREMGEQLGVDADIVVAERIELRRQLHQRKRRLQLRIEVLGHGVRAPEDAQVTGFAHRVWKDVGRTEGRTFDARKDMGRYRATQEPRSQAAIRQTRPAGRYVCA